MFSVANRKSCRKKGTEHVNMPWKILVGRGKSSRADCVQLMVEFPNGSLAARSTWRLLPTATGWGWAKLS